MPPARRLAGVAGESVPESTRVRMGVGNDRTGSSTTAGAPERDRYRSVLQIVCAVAIVAFHAGLRGASTGWIAVELFFVLAGFPMASLFARYPDTGCYALERVRRMAPELALIWVSCIVLLLTGWPARNLLLFLGSAPFFLQNLMEPLYGYESDVSWTFLPSMWFVAALLQLQVVFFVLRHRLRRTHAVTLLTLSVVCGTLFRVSLALSSGPLQRHLGLGDSYVIYVMPFTHLEAITLGYLIGRGSLPRFGLLLPVALIAALILGALNRATADAVLPLTSFGFPSGMRSNFQYLWGYPLLAFLAAAICAPDSGFAHWVRNWRPSAARDGMIHSLAGLTYGVYVFHGLVLTLLRQWCWPEESLTQRSRLLIFATTTAAAFMMAWAFVAARRQFAKALTRPVAIQRQPGLNR